MDAFQVFAFSNAEERVARVRAFVAANLEARQRVFVVAPSDDPDFLRARVAELHGFESAAASGAALVVPASAFDHAGVRSPVNLRTFHEALVEQARSDGFAGVSACMDVTSLLDGGAALPAVETLIRSALPPSFHVLLLFARADRQQRSAMPDPSAPDGA